MKKFLCLILTVLMLLSCAGCGTIYEDTNGDDDYSLQTITDENIIQLNVGASGLSYSETTLDSLSISSGYHSRNFNGVERIYLADYIFPSDVSVYIGTFSVNKGNFEAVAIHNDQIIQEFTPDSFNQTFIFEDLTGSFSIHLAGESADFDLFIEVY